MSYSTAYTAKHGTITSSATDYLQIDLSGGSENRAVLVFTVTASDATVLHIRSAATAAELTSPPESLSHERTVAVAANTTEDVVMAHNPALPHVRAWVATGSGNYVLHAASRAHS